MTKNIRTAVFVVLFVAFFACGAFAEVGQAAATSWPHVRVTTIDDVVYGDVTAIWGLDGFSIKLLAADGTMTVLSPSQVASIWDGAGNDITNVIAAASPASDGISDLIGDRRTVPFEFHLMLTAGGSGTMNKGDGSFHPAGAVFTGARIPIGSLAHFHILYRRQRIVEGELTTGGSVSSDANELHFLLGFRVTHPQENNNYTYMELGVSLVNFEQRYNMELSTWNKDCGSATGVIIQGGVVFPLSSTIGFDLGGIMRLGPTVVEDGRHPGLLAGINGALALSF